MTYQQAGRVAVVKRIAGWIVFIPAMLSTLISLANLIHAFTERKQGINGVMQDFLHLVVEVLRFNTPFLDIFWYNSPVPDFNQLQAISTIMFWLIYMLMFVGLAMQVSGARLSRQVIHIREGLEDQLILEKIKGVDGKTKTQLESLIILPRHTVLVQYFPLYVLPVIVAVIGYMVLKLLGLAV
ncbi:YniB family protein [Pectobacteriaceae bacterium CE70]|nr:YniB family protein [Pectobacteriaceae bacterium CE70]WJY09133.1 YniB family protein [Pectobacteriaceae bacterium C80]